MTSKVWTKNFWGHFKSLLTQRIRVYLLLGPSNKDFFIKLLPLVISHLSYHKVPHFMSKEILDVHSLETH